MGWMISGEIVLNPGDKSSEVELDDIDFLITLVSLFCAEAV